MTGRYFLSAGLVLAAIAGLAPAGTVAPVATVAAQNGDCAGAKAYLDEQVANGRSLNTFSGEEARWAVRARLDPTFMAGCTSVPAALQERMRGGLPDTGEHQRMNCHIAFDYLLGEVRAGQHRLLPAEVTQPEKEWARAYSNSLAAGTACPAPPELLGARATGHLVSTEEGRAGLDAAYKAGDSDATARACRATLIRALPTSRSPLRLAMPGPNTKLPCSTCSARLT